MLSELNDIEVIWLRYYRERTIDEKQTFHSKHKNILDKEIVVLGSDVETRRKVALQESYTEHLERLGLIKHHLDMQKVASDNSGLHQRRLSSQDINVPNYDNFGKLKVSYSETTVLGNMLLEYIGLINHEDTQK